MESAGTPSSWTDAAHEFDDFERAARTAGVHDEFHFLRSPFGYHTIWPATFKSLTRLWLGAHFSFDPRTSRIGCAMAASADPQEVLKGEELRADLPWNEAARVFDCCLATLRNAKSTPRLSLPSVLCAVGLDDTPVRHSRRQQVHAAARWVFLMADEHFAQAND